MNVVIGSAFRNAGPNAVHYMERVAALRDELSVHVNGGSLRVIAVEGDSHDNTREALRLSAEYHKLDLDLVTCNHGGPVFGSTEAPERLEALSKVGNAIFDAVRDTDDVLVYVESDLLWAPETIMLLIDQARYSEYDVMAPLVMAGRAFYDIWGFRWLDGTRFSPFEHQTKALSLGVQEIGSAGSCLVMRANVARNARIRNNYCLVGWCEDARRLGFRIAIDPSLVVRQL